MSNYHRVLNEIYSSKRTGKHARAAQKKYEDNKVVEQTQNNKFRGRHGTHEGTVFPMSLGDKGNTKHTSNSVSCTRQRVDGIHDSILPTGTEKRYADDDTAQNIINGMHPITMVEHDSNAAVLEAPQVGSKTTLQSYGRGSPETDGNTNSLRPTSFASGGPGSMSLVPGGGKIVGTKDAFKRGSAIILEPPEAPAKAADVPDPPPKAIEKIYTAFGETIKPADIPDHSVRIVGIRNPGVTPSTANNFRDAIMIFVKAGDDWLSYSWTITTSPGKDVLGEFMYKPTGTANLAFPQLAPDAYKIGCHGCSKETKYDALKQAGSMYSWLDANHNEIPDNDSTENVSMSKIGAGSAVNIHRASKTGTSSGISGDSSNLMTVYYTDADDNVVETTIDKYTWSAGCQVFASGGDFEKFMAYMKKDQSENGTQTWDYTMLMKNDYNNIVSGQDISEYLTERADYYKELAG